jgi:hypothetical protein
MAEKLKWSFSAQVAGGPTLAGTGDIADVDAYVKLNVIVPANGNQDVEVLTGTGGAVELLVISPAKPSAKLTYEVDGDDVPLDGPVVLIGAGAASLLADTIGTLKFKNGTAEDAAISILAARDATP